MNVGQEIADAMEQITREADEERYRTQYRDAMRVIRDIPSGTNDADLTEGQREAWRLHDEAVRWIHNHPEVDA